MIEKQRVAQGDATLYDVARLAGVSAMTVSRVINGTKRVNDDTRERVATAAAQLKYEVNVAARAARVGSLRIGLLYSNPSAAFLSAFLVGAMDQCSSSGARLILEKCEGQRGWRDAIDNLVAGGVNGILLTPPLCDSLPVLKLLAELDIPAVAVATARPSKSTSAVRIDDYEGALSMVRHLISLGHRDIAFIKGDPKHTPAQLRYRAFLDAMEEAGLEVPPARVAEGMFTYRSGLPAARRLLEQSERPSAIFACNDDMAAAVVAVAHGMRLEVPRDLAVCGFDDTPLATTVWPNLTTVHQPIGEMGQVAVELISEQIRCQRKRLPSVVEHRLLPYNVVPRLSSTRDWKASA
ncbi:LacI family DNA-binding transcriptional regulator [Pseudoduganella sp. LjRoot289]|uniref:LacI family DNA-binding transcriptional regulator n=1 Tax=Pseudoduganella sp. LjRoot289 TaxID=3342314 RepID=UPI003ECFEF63